MKTYKNKTQMKITSYFKTLSSQEKRRQRIYDETDAEDRKNEQIEQYNAQHAMVYGGVRWDAVPLHFLTD
jgi:thiosulfate reductase cytochrome b subunit